MFKKGIRKLKDLKPGIKLSKLNSQQSFIILLTAIISISVLLFLYMPDIIAIFKEDPVKTKKIETLEKGLVNLKDYSLNEFKEVREEVSYKNSNVNKRVTQCQDEQQTLYKYIISLELDKRLPNIESLLRLSVKHSSNAEDILREYALEKLTTYKDSLKNENYFTNR